MMKKRMKVQIYCRQNGFLVHETEILMCATASIQTNTAAFESYLEALMTAFYPKTAHCSRIFDPNALMYCKFWEVI
jgi:hypothetical protein